MSERMGAEERWLAVDGWPSHDEFVEQIQAAEAQARAERDEEWKRAVNRARAWKESRSPCIFLYYPGHRCECENCAPIRSLLATVPTRES